MTAGQGAVSQAISIVLAAALTARGNGQVAPEVMCLQTATQFGDISTASRLGELEGIVEGPRVGVAARFATALQTGDGAQLSSVSEVFERMGDLIVDEHLRLPARKWPVSSSPVASAGVTQVPILVVGRIPRAWFGVPEQPLGNGDHQLAMASYSLAMSPGDTCCGQLLRRLRSGLAMPCSSDHSAWWVAK